jgi:hypothetical protein
MLVHEAVVALGVVPRDANIFILRQSVLLGACMLCYATRQGTAEQYVGRQPYHVESDHIAKRNLACFVALDKMLVD